MSHMSVGPGLPTGLAGPCALGPGGACPGVLGFGAAVGRRMDFGAAGWGSTIVTLFATPSGGLGSPSSTFLFFCSCCSRYCLASAAEGPVGGGHIGGFGLGGFGHEATFLLLGLWAEVAGAANLQANPKGQPFPPSPAPPPHTQLSGHCHVQCQQQQQDHRTLKQRP